MVFYPVEPDLTVLIHACCARGTDVEFSEFRSAWHPYLEAGLALVGANWNTTERMYGPIYGEYREKFNEPFNYELDYETYFLAIGFSHVVKVMGDHALRELLVRMFDNLPRRLTGHEV